MLTPDFLVSFFDTATHFTGHPLTDAMIRAAEAKLGYKLPEAYLQLLRVKNGGSPSRQCFPTGRSGWADDHVRIISIRGVGFPRGIDSHYQGSRFMIEEWGYPDVGIYLADTPSAGHDGIMLDYRECGPEGEPCVIHVDTEADAPEIQVLAPNVETFLRGLVDCGPFQERIDRAVDELQGKYPWMG
jgi:SMI1/KNR4 family protein SUKH-1